MSRSSAGRVGSGRHGQDLSHRVMNTMRQAIEAHQAGRLDEAEAGYRRALQMKAGQPDALHFLGVLRHQRGESDDGARLIRMALRAVPGHAEAHNNLGNIQKESGHLAEAEACYRRALACVPHHLDALGNLAIVLEAQQRPAEALRFYEELLQQAPRLGRAHMLMGLFKSSHLDVMEDLADAVECFREAWHCDQTDTRALQELGVSLYVLGRREEALDVYRDWLSREPNHPVPRHMLASCGGGTMPARADDAYIREIFDGFADSFDEQLLDRLDYRAPQVLTEHLVGMLGQPAARLDVLDAGCGTGLCAPLVRPYARRLHGVDLSGKMIDKARSRGGYDALEVAELGRFLGSGSECWDLVLSADTLIYFGDLHEVVQATHASLRPGGILAFTLEVLEGDDDRVELHPSGRYQHSRRHVLQALEAAGFGEVRMAAHPLRKELGRPVSGWVILARRGN